MQTSVVLISHDLAVVAQLADRVAVMYAGAIIEEASVYDIFENPLHPYTQALLERHPSQKGRKEKLETIPGSVPTLFKLPDGCSFHPRCKFAMTQCYGVTPILKEVSPGHKVACLLHESR